MHDPSQLAWTTVQRKVSELIPFETNPRKITDEQMEVLKNSLQKFNVVELPAIDLDGKIIAGHQRIRALQLLGRGEEIIDVRYPNRKLTDEEYREYLLTSNRSGGNWDFDILSEHFDVGELLISGFDADDLNMIYDDYLEVTDDEFDEQVELEKIQETDIKTGDHFMLGRHHLICADSLDQNTVKRLVGDVRIDMINTDLPYNINLSYDKGVSGKSSYGGDVDDNKTDEEYSVFVKTMMQNALAVAKPDAHVIFWCDERYVGLFQDTYRKLGVDSKRLCIWIKDNASPTPKQAFNKVTEYAVYGTIGKPYLSDRVKNLNEIQNKEMGSGNRLTDDILDQINIWLVKRLPITEYEHPTQKPPTLHEKALRRCTRPGDTILDLTAGSGSILAACHMLKRTVYMAEQNPRFCQLIINRFKQLAPYEPIIKLD